MMTLMRALPGVLFVLLSAALLLGPATGGTGALPGQNGLIAFASGRDGNYEIYSMTPEAAAQTRLTRDPATDVDPAWSPDGTRIAFTSNRGGDDDIYVINADGSGQTRLTTSQFADANPTWSPGGRNIAFASARDGGDSEIFVMNADGSGQHSITSAPGSDAVPAWSPDGTKIAFTSNRNGNPEIYVINVDGSNQTRLTTNPSPDVGPNWSPDGTKIAFYSERDGNAEIYVINADGSGQTRLTRNTAIDLDPAWAPDGRKIAFTSNRDGNYEIYSMTSDGRDQTRLTTNSDDDTTPVWQPLQQPPEAVRSAEFRGIWRESAYRGALEVTGSVDGPATLQLTLRRAGRIVLSTALDLSAGAFRAHVALPAGLLPGSYALHVGTDASPTPLTPQDLGPLLASPREGVVTKAWAGTQPGGVPLERFPSRTFIVFAHFRFAALPKAGLPLTASWYRLPDSEPVKSAHPQTTGLVVTYLRTTNGIPIPSGSWRCVLRAGLTVVKRLSFRIGIG